MVLLDFGLCCSIADLGLGMDGNIVVGECNCSRGNILDASYNNYAQNATDGENIEYQCVALW